MDKLDGPSGAGSTTSALPPGATNLRRIQNIRKATPAPIDEAINLMQLTSRACELFTQQSAAEQRRLLQVVVQKSTWQDGTLRTTLFEPLRFCAIRTRKVIEKKTR